jgi:hypothetical protein
MNELKAVHTIEGGTEEVAVIDMVISSNDTIYIMYLKEDGTINGDTIDKFIVSEAVHFRKSGT